MTKREAKLWMRYQRSRSIPDRNALVEFYLPDLDAICRGRTPRVRTGTRAAGRRLARSVMPDDVADAAVRLMECVESFDPRRGSFRSYLYQGVHQMLASKSGRPTTTEVGNTVAASPTVPLSPELPDEEHEPAADREDELRRICARVLRSKRHVDAIVATFPRQERRAMQLMFFEGMTNKEVARKLQVTPGRVSQIRKKALARLRAALGTGGA